MMIIGNTGEAMMTRVGSELGEEELEGLLLRQATFSGGNRGMKGTISKQKIWKSPRTSGEVTGTKLLTWIEVTLTIHPEIGRASWHLGMEQSLWCSPTEKQKLKECSVQHRPPCTNL